MDVQTATVVIAGISVVIGVINSMISSRRVEQQRNVQLFMELYETYRTKERYQRFYNALYKTDVKQMVGKRYGPDTDIELLSEMAALFSYYEGIGFLVKNKWIDIKHIEDLGLSISIVLLWQRYAGWIREDREREHVPRLWKNFEYLANEIQRREQMMTINA